MANLFNGFIHHLPNQSKGLANQVLPIKSIRLPPAKGVPHLGAIYVVWTDGWGREGSFIDDAMCTQLTVARETAWGHASSYRGDWQQQQHTKIIREIEKIYVIKKQKQKNDELGKEEKKENKQKEVMRSNPHPVVERKWCHMSTVIYSDYRLEPRHNKPLKHRFCLKQRHSNLRTILTIIMITQCL